MLSNIRSITFVQVVPWSGACLVIVTTGVSRAFVARRDLVWLVVGCVQ